MLCKLATFGVQGKLLKWIENFLTNRLQRVVIYGCLSHTAPVISGVSQGSVLGPLLFIMFADAKIFWVIKCKDKYVALQKDLDALHILFGN